MDLFTPSAPWVNASKQVNVFELYGGWVARGTTDSILSQVVSDLNRRGMAIAFEANPIELNDNCQTGPSAWTSEGLQISQRIRDAGGVVSFVAMDSPFGRANLDSPCHWSAGKVAAAVEVYIEAIKSVFPEVVVGDTEPLWGDDVVPAYENWMVTFGAVTGHTLPFFHLDTEWTLPNWPKDALELENFAHQNGIKFGMLYEDNYNSYYSYPKIDTSYTDQVWFSRAESHMVTYEAEYGGHPDQVLFQSWVDKPDYVLPETAPYSFTHLVLRYVRERTALGVTIGQASPDGARLLSGNLTLLDGKPLGDTPIIARARLLDGPPIFAEYTISGVVPDTVDEADVGFRVNTECGCIGHGNFTLYWVSYTEGSNSVNLVPNPRFSEGLDYWGYWGNGSLRLMTSDRESGLMLRVAVTPTESLGLNSNTFPVTPGANYTLVFGASIASTSVSSGYFDIVFINQTEITRRMIDLGPPLLTLGTSTTDSSGAFSFTLSGLPTGTFRIQVEYVGDDTHWPAYAETNIVS